MSDSNAKPLALLTKNQQVFLEKLEEVVVLAKTGQLLAGSLVTVEANGNSETTYAFDNSVQMAQLAFGAETLKAALVSQLLFNAGRLKYSKRK